jgi:hypothetical protein
MLADALGRLAEYVIDPKIVARLVQRRREELLLELSDREREVLVLIRVRAEACSFAGASSFDCLRFVPYAGVLFGPFWSGVRC